MPRNTRQVSGKYFIIYWIKYFKIGLKIRLKILWDDIFIIMFYLEVSHIEILEITWTNHCVKSVRIRSYSGPYFPRIFPHSKWIRIDTEYLSVFSPNAGKCGTEKISVFEHFSRSGVRRDWSIFSKSFIRIAQFSLPKWQCRKKMCCSFSFKTTCTKKIQCIHKNVRKFGFTQVVKT